MADMTTQYSDEGNKGIIERRMGDRRCRDRRNSSNNSMKYSGKERRSSKANRRTTIFNRLKREVTDRRSLN
jgi:hypothetical protein